MRQDLIETAGPQAHVAAPILVVLPDPESRADVQRLVLGRRPVERLAAHARRAGFSGVLMGPGTQDGPPGAEEVATGDPVDRPALVVYEGTGVHPELLRLMVAHPLEADERFTLNDAVGRPCAAFIGELAVVPSMMPVAEELPWPEDMGTQHVVRLVYEEDRPRAEALVLRDEVGLPPIPGDADSAWNRFVTRPILRWLADCGRPVAQLELLALALAVAVLPLSLAGGHVGLVAASLCMMLAVVIARLLPVVRRLHERDPDPDDDTETPDPTDDGDRLSRAARPLTHAAAMVGLTYGLVAETDRSGVAGFVLLGAGAAATLLSLLQARRLLRGGSAGVFALPDPHALTQRLDVTLPHALEGAPLLELMVVVVSPLGVTALPWSVLAASAVARLWRWYAGPISPP